MPVDQLLPEGDEDEAAKSDQTDSGAKINLARLEGLEGSEADMLSRYLLMIQVQRQDFNGRVITIRRDDMRAIACILGMSEEHVPGRLAELGLRLN